MASYYWAKVWIEVIYDYKMAAMSDHLWRRTIELVLLAKERNDDGYLPKLEEMSFKLHTNPEILEAELNDLAGLEIAERRQDGWYLINFADRQGAMADTERKTRQRERDKKKEYHDSDTVKAQASHVAVTNRDTEQNRIDKNRVYKSDASIHSGTAYEHDPADTPSAEYYQKRNDMVLAINDVVKEQVVFGQPSEEKFNRVAEMCMDAGDTPEFIRGHPAYWDKLSDKPPYDGAPWMKSFVDSLKDYRKSVLPKHSQRDIVASALTWEQGKSKR